MNKIFLILALIFLFLSLYFFFIERNLFGGSIAFILCVVFNLFFAMSGNVNKLDENNK